MVVALGGNALLRRGEPMTADVQRGNVKTAAPALASVAGNHQLVLSHGNGPQVGLLALQAAAFAEVEASPLDVLGAQTEGMIGGGNLIESCGVVSAAVDPRGSRRPR